MRSLLCIFIFIFLFSCGEEGKKKNDAGANSLVKIKYPLTKNVDSLIALLKILPGDSNKINVLNTLAAKLKKNNPDTAIILEDEAVAICKKINWKKGLARSLTGYGVFYRLKGDFPKALDYNLKALELNEALNDKNKISGILINIGNIYKDMGEYAKSIDYYQRGLAAAKEAGNRQWQSNALGNIGSAYHALGDYQKSLEFYAQSQKIYAEIGDRSGTAINYSSIGNVWAEQKNYPVALDYFLKAKNIEEELGDKNELAAVLGNIGTLYLLSGKYNDAYECLYKGIAFSQNIGAADRTRFLYDALSQLYENSTIPLPDSIGGKILNMEQMRLRSLHYFKSYVNLRDTLFSQENKKQLVQKEMNYEFDKKQEKQKAGQDKKDALAKEQLKQKETERNYFIAGFALVLALAGFIFRSYRQKQKANEIISQQKLMVEEKQKEILDSIHYAKRIQRSLLPNEKYIARNLNS